MTSTPLPHAEPPGELQEDARPERASIARNAAILAAATITARLAGFVLAIALGRKLGVESYGRYGFAAAIGTIVAPLCDLGLATHVQREVARRGDAAAGVVRGARRAKFLSSGIALAVVTALALSLEHNGETGAAIAIMTGAMLADGMASLVFGYFQGRERMGFQAASTVWTQLARGLGGAAIALITGELLPVIVWIAVTSLAQAAVSLRRLEADLGPAGRGRRDPVDWRTAFALGLVTLFALIYLRIDSVLLGWQATERDVGFYTAAYTLMAAAQIVPWMISSALTPAFARTFANDRPAFERTWQEGVRLVLLIALPLTLPLSLLAHDTVTRVYGPGFAAAGRPLAILAWCTPVWALNMVLSGVVNASGRERRLAATIGFGAALNLGINLWAIPRYGTQGAAAVTLATETTMLAGLAYILARDRVVAIPQLPMVRILAALAACAGVALALRHVEVLLALAASAVAYGAVLGATGVIDAQDLRRTRAALRRSA